MLNLNNLILQSLFSTGRIYMKTFIHSIQSVLFLLSAISSRLLPAVADPYGIGFYSDSLHVYATEARQAEEFLFDKSIGKFNSASAISVNAAGFIYVTDRSRDEIYKLNEAGDLLARQGGYGWNTGAFDDPADVYAGILNVYVADMNNHRIQVFDKDLNFLYSLEGRNSGNRNNEGQAEFEYPAAVSVSNQGDVFVSDSENRRIVKLSPDGSRRMTFGGYDAGEFQLSHPMGLAVTNNNTVAVIDREKLVLFDQFGLGLAASALAKGYKGIKIFDRYAALTADSAVMINAADKQQPAAIHALRYLNEAKLTGNPYDEDPGRFISSVYTGSRLFILKEKRIDVYIKKKAE